MQSTKPQGDALTAIPLTPFGALRSGERLRHAVVLGPSSGSRLLYDLERTFIFGLPQSPSAPCRQGVPEMDPLGSFDHWLRDNDLITRSSRRQWPDSTAAGLPKLTDLSIDLSGSCNMSCDYCFEQPIASRIGKMDAATLEESVRFAFGQAEGSASLTFHFGSGEPLLRFAQLRRLVELARARAQDTGIGIGFELTTNATLVNEEIAKFLARESFNVRVSCDGPGEIHDRHRRLSDGAASYQRVMEGLRHLMDVMPERVTVNTVVCRGARLSTIWHWACELGLRHLHAIKVGTPANDPLAPHEASEFDNYHADLAAICQDIDRDLRHQRVPIDFQPVTKVVRRLMIPAPINRFCGVAGSYLGVSSDGAVYPCFRHLGLAHYRLGDIAGGVTDAARLRYLSQEAAGVDERLDCRDCWARYLCGGACYADSVVYGPDIHRPQVWACAFRRAEIAHGITFFAHLRDTDPLMCIRLFGDDPERVLEDLAGNSASFFGERKTF